jgi:hypothetical protein
MALEKIINDLPFKKNIDRLLEEIRKSNPNNKYSLNDFLVGSYQNRITLYSHLITLSTLGIYIKKDMNEDFSVSELILTANLSIILALYLATGFGVTTKKIYDNTLKRINKNKPINEIYVKKILKYSRNNMIFGYCELQGIYLAMKKSGKKKEFEDLLKTSNISKKVIPFF